MVHRRDAVTIEAAPGRVVTGWFDEPADGWALLVLAHGAGAGMTHGFMEALAGSLVARGVAVLRFPFPYMEDGRRRPDPPRTLTSTVRGAVAEAARRAGTRPLFAGGKSMGGRMTSLAASEHPLEGVRGMVFFGFPLHAAGKPATSRGDHLAKVDAPLLFLQGTRDALADLELLRGVVERSGARARVHVVEGADHGFHVLKRSGRTDEEVMEEIVTATVSWMRDARG
jgi:hypothetical protein